VLKAGRVEAVGAGVDTSPAPKVPYNSSSCFAKLLSLLLRFKDQEKPDAGGFYF
jgi:hypothetical protein